MVIRFSKPDPGRPDRHEALSCLRDDGSCTWQKSSVYFVRHDLIHYAVETTLGYRDAFWGLVAQGKDLDAFGTRGGVKDHYTLQEGWAESIVGLLQWPSVSGGPDLSANELLAMLAKSCSDHETPNPALAPEQIVRIRDQMRTLHEMWDRIPPGETLELRFSLN